MVQLKSLKKKDWGNALVTFYIVKRSLRNKVATYKLMEVSADDDLRMKLRSTVTGKIERSNAVKDYDFHTTDQDDGLLTIGSTETDFAGILEEMTGSENPPERAGSIEDLTGAWMYLIRLDLQNAKDGTASARPLIAARKISQTWQTKKVSSLANAIFRDNMLVDISNKNVFKIEGLIDFFSYDGLVFIAHKANFESALNFRAGMEKNRDEVIAEFKSKQLFSNADDLSKLIGDNMRRLRKISQIKKSGYYLRPRFLERLKIVNEEEEWGIPYDSNGQIVADEQNIETILTVLNNDRLFSKINDEEFDVDSKQKLES